MSGISENETCKKCNGTGFISDGVIDCLGGEILEQEIECVRDCPDCAESEQKQEWIDLTDDDIDLLVTLYAPPNREGFDDDEHWDFVYKVIQAFKRKQSCKDKIFKI